MSGRVWGRAALDVGKGAMQTLFTMMILRSESQHSIKGASGRPQNRAGNLLACSKVRVYV